MGNVVKNDGGQGARAQGNQSQSRQQGSPQGQRSELARREPYQQLARDPLDLAFCVAFGC